MYIWLKLNVSIKLKIYRVFPSIQTIYEGITVKTHDDRILGGGGLNHVNVFKLQTTCIGMKLRLISPAVSVLSETLC